MQVLVDRLCSVGFPKHCAEAVVDNAMNTGKIEDLCDYILFREKLERVKECME